MDRDWLMRRAKQAAPLEACGFIMENGDIVEMRNTSLAPMRHFKMDRLQLVQKIRDRVDFISGIWHTHPKGSIHPSQTDLDGIRAGAIQTNWDYFIVTANDVHLYMPASYAPKDHSHWHRFAV